MEVDLQQVLINPVPTPFVFASNNPTDYLAIITRLLPWFSLRAGISDSQLGYTLQRAVPAAVAIANGVRIGEVLKMKCRQLMSNGVAWVAGEKGSRARNIWIGFQPQMPEMNVAKWEDSIVFPWTYQQVYNACKVLGIGELQREHRNFSVTHLGRYRLAQLVQAQAGLRAAAEVLGHRRTSSTEHYIHAVNLEKDRERKQRQRDAEKSARIKALLNSGDFYD